MVQASFTQMADGTEADFAVIHDHMDAYRSGLAERVLRHLALLAGSDGGWAVDRLEHSVQTATRAQRAGKDSEYVVCALLHDIGDPLGTYNHAELAATILAPFVSAENYWMIANHDVFQGYYFWKYIGKDPDAREKFRDHPCFAATMEFCVDFDQAAFDPNYPSLRIEDFEPMVRDVFAAPRKG
jgi:predicted HD phosphohydrolase